MSDYREKLALMNAEELQKELDEAQLGQSKTKSEFFYWSWQAQIDAVEDSQRLLMINSVKWLCTQYGLTRIKSYVDELVEADKKQKQIRKLEREIEDV